ncbi:YcgJ family protein [Cyanobium sp. CH-040]|uniref:YcgJ family protein n=1 Tax=Cyanobium sp. CH-040 TaxID=2823708 RepID=UPI0020CD9F12|nr:YcgJ family protein [Cyanobium sp. CH-040]MCP9928650.1 hypothetical protein [Cyanobium sp. CH-040]
MPPLRPAVRSAVRALPVLAAVSLGMAPAQAQLQMFGGISSPAPGVVCDRIAMTCFNGSGPSVDLTRQHLGNSAALRLSASLSGRPPASEFRLSNGAVCSVRESTCWTDSRRKRVSDALTRDLFAASPNPDREVSRSRGLCSLSQRGRAVYDGNCDLRVVSRDSGISRYAVSTADGRRYVFRRRGDTLELEDATGTWPVDFRNHGYTGLFRWSDMTLVATREHSLLPLAQPRAAGRGAEIDALFSGGSN